MIVKNIMLSIVFFLTIMACKAQFYPQGVVPLENYSSYVESLAENESIPGGLYFKDVNNVLDKYLGTWTGSYEGKDYLFEITKKIAVSDNIGSDPLKFDELRIHYKITNSSGEVLANTLNLPDESVYVISGLTFADDQSKLYRARYQGEQTACGQSGVLFLDMRDTDSTHFKVYIVRDEVYLKEDKCPNGYIAPPFPQWDETPMIFTKQ